MSMSPAGTGHIMDAVATLLFTPLSIVLVLVIKRFGANEPNPAYVGAFIRGVEAVVRWLWGTKYVSQWVSRLRGHWIFVRVSHIFVSVTRVVKACLRGSRVRDHGGGNGEEQGGPRSA